MESARSWRATGASSMPSAGSNLAWLESLSPWPEEFGLGRIGELLRRLGTPQRRFRAIHVVGSNGKTTTVRSAEALLVAEGVDAGAYTSPHVVSWSERIRVGGEEADLEAALGRVRAEAEAVGATQFEALTAAAFAEFASAGVDAAVVEAGLGGRHDATNALDAPVVVLTNVALEHTDVLGNTREAIAAEKLAVVGPGALVVLGEPEWEAAARAAGAAGVTVVAGSSGVLAHAAVESFLGRPVDPGPLANVVVPGPARACGRVAARDLGRRTQPRRRRLSAHARSPRGLGPGRIDPGRQGRNGHACRALGARRPSGGDLVLQPARPSGGRARGVRAAVLPAGRGRDGARCGACARTRSRGPGRRRARHRIPLSAHGPGLRPPLVSTMASVGERLSAFVLVAVVLVAIVALAFGAGWFVGKVLL